MRKTILAYILNCIEEIPNDFDLGTEIRQLAETMTREIEKDEEEIMLKIILLYIIVFPNDFQLGMEVRNLYNEIKYFFDEYKNDTNGNSN